MANENNEANVQARVFGGFQRTPVPDGDQWKNIAIMDVTGTFGTDGAGEEALVVREIIASARKDGVTELRVRVNCFGGLVWEAMPIYDALKAAVESGMKVVAEVHGMAASSASLILMAASEVLITPSSQIMVHEPRVKQVGGTAGDLRVQAEKLGQVWKRMCEIYAERTGKTVEQIEADHTGRDVYYSAEQAVAYGLADRIATADDVLPPVQGRPYAAVEDQLVAEDEKAAMEAERASLKAELDALKAENDALKAAKSALEAEKTALEAEKESLASAASEEAVQKRVIAELSGMGVPVATLPASSSSVGLGAVPSQEKLKAWVEARDVDALLTYAATSPAAEAAVRGALGDSFTL